MKRRDVLRSLAAAAAVGGAAGIASAQPRGGTALSPTAVEELMRAHGLEPLPGEPAQVRMLLLSTRMSETPDPRIEPVTRLDPELE